MARVKLYDFVATDKNAIIEELLNIQEVIFNEEVDYIHKAENGKILTEEEIDTAIYVLSMLDFWTVNSNVDKFQHLRFRITK